jgi:hypothetical protein
VGVAKAVGVEREEEERAVGVGREAQEAGCTPAAVSGWLLLLEPAYC